jgi:hypothetical protein
MADLPSAWVSSAQGVGKWGVMAQIIKVLTGSLLQFSTKCGN